MPVSRSPAPFHVSKRIMPLDTLTLASDLRHALVASRGCIAIFDGNRIEEIGNFAGMGRSLGRWRPQRIRDIGKAIMPGRDALRRELGGHGPRPFDHWAGRDVT